MADSTSLEQLDKTSETENRGNGSEPLEEGSGRTLRRSTRRKTRDATARQLERASRAKRRSTRSHQKGTSRTDCSSANLGDTEEAGIAREGKEEEEEEEERNEWDAGDEVYDPSDVQSATETESEAFTDDDGGSDDEFMPLRGASRRRPVWSSRLSAGKEKQEEEEKGCLRRSQRVRKRKRSVDESKRASPPRKRRRAGQRDTGKAERSSVADGASLSAEGEDSESSRTNQKQRPKGLGTLSPIGKVLGARIREGLEVERFICACCDMPRRLFGVEKRRVAELSDHPMCESCLVSHKESEVPRHCEVMQVWSQEQGRWLTARIVDKGDGDTQMADKHESDETPVTPLLVSFLKPDGDETCALNLSQATVKYYRCKEKTLRPYILEKHGLIEAKTHVVTTPPSALDEDLYFDKDDEPNLDFYVTFARKSHIHCEWVSYEALFESLNSMEMGRLFGQWAKSGRARSVFELQREKPKEDVSSTPSDVPSNSLSVQPREDGSIRYFDPHFTRIDRILSHQNESKRRPRSYLVKWQHLNYGAATWETWQDLQEHDAEATNAAVRQYREMLKGLPQELGEEAKEKAEQRGKERRKPEIDGEHLSNCIPMSNGTALKPYQTQGVDWLCLNWHTHRSVLLADEMGLGKTCQSVTFLNYLNAVQGIRGPFLVVAPLSTVQHWKRETETFTDMYPVVYSGTRQDREVILEHDFYVRNTQGKALKPLYRFNVLITTYDSALNDSRLLGGIEWKALIVDEAHRIKNQKSKLWSLLQRFISDFTLLLTGTPVQNNVEELWSLLHFIDSSCFPSLEAFVQEFGHITDMEQVDKMHDQLRAHVLRRLKRDVEVDLKPRSEVLVYVELTRCQKLLYRAVFEKNREILAQKTKRVTSLRNIAMQLRKICCHPYLIDGIEDEEMAKYGIRKEDLDAVYNHLMETSGKFILLDKLLPKLRKEGHKVLVYSQFTRVLDILQDYISWKKYGFERLDGSVSGDLRQQMIDRFSDPLQDKFLFLLSTRAGGVGINLTAADVVIIFDSDWNPQNDIQAQSRCHRIGQTKQVTVYRLISRNSYEMYMYEKASEKLFLDHCVLHSIRDRKGVKSQKNHALEKKELEKMLQASMESMKDSPEEEKKMREFCEMDIDSILAKCVTVQVEAKASALQNSALSKATFVPKRTESQLSFDDPNFWEKCGFTRKKSEVIASDDNTPHKTRRSKRRRTKTNYAEEFSLREYFTSDESDIAPSDIEVNDERSDSEYSAEADAKEDTSSSEEYEDPLEANDGFGIGRMKVECHKVSEPKPEHLGKRKQRRKERRKARQDQKSAENREPSSVTGVPSSMLSPRGNAVHANNGFCQQNTIHIDNFANRQKELKSAFFVVGEWQWQISIYPRGRHNPKQEIEGHSVAVGLKFLGRVQNPTLEDRVYVSLQCTVIAQKTEYNIQSDVEHIFTQPGEVCGIEEVIPLSCVVRTPFYLWPKGQNPNDTLMLQTQVTATRRIPLTRRGVATLAGTGVHTLSRTVSYSSIGSQKNNPIALSDDDS